MVKLSTACGIGIGMALGAIIGTLLGNVTMGLGIGLALAIAMGLVINPAGTGIDGSGATMTVTRPGETQPAAVPS